MIISHPLHGQTNKGSVIQAKYYWVALSFIVSAPYLDFPRPGGHFSAFGGGRDATLNATTSIIQRLAPQGALGVRLDLM